MATASSILTLVKTHPASLKESLHGICNELEIEFDPKETKVTLQGKIDDYARMGDENDAKVRGLITQIKNQHKERNPSNTGVKKHTSQEHNLQPESQSQSQLLFNETQEFTLCDILL